MSDIEPLCDSQNRPLFFNLQSESAVGCVFTFYKVLACYINYIFLCVCMLLDCTEEKLYEMHKKVITSANSSI